MNDEWKLPWTGGCRCDRVRFRVTTPPLVTSACHCRGCQRMTAGPFSMSLMLLSEGFTLTSGEPAIGGLHGPSRHFYCPHCKSWMFTRPDGMDHLVMIRATMLDDHAWFVPFMETATSEKLPWVTTPAKHSFPDLPPPEQYGPLMQDFAARGPRPR
ncbi:GFA family protein [Nannocystis bainbridge]|uniref:GFA family protein n=1 Tax=Nannocystis bainbridge TaxID=2995303 RepID=A0ABT5E0X2_9BACT|nr:GFA family protein [Nannocystis bainbridge]MDC0718351.1 GFA family protein [Nannocystis bainbridge]